ncbi:hypothetical protein [Streptomyces blastmyceticus]|uniref:GNAT family N-acetyltransferase n=1 Tax=Streptomyces blastmyceticus TaxID=68180 RepID=A0ABN0WFH8_9ACTN
MSDELTVVRLDPCPTAAADNGPMRAVNKLLGYRPERSVGLFQVRLPSG